MKKNFLALSILGIIGFTSGSYTVKVPLEQLNGGSLPKGSITFKNKESETPELLDCIDNPSENTVECNNRLTAWESFAESRELSKNWSGLEWYDNNLTELPIEPYPLTNVEYIDFYNNKIKNLDPFSNLKIVNDYLHFGSNELTNVEGLRNLTNINYLEISNNPITKFVFLHGL